MYHCIGTCRWQACIGTTEMVTCCHAQIALYVRNRECNSLCVLVRCGCGPSPPVTPCFLPLTDVPPPPHHHSCPMDLLVLLWPIPSNEATLWPGLFSQAWHMVLHAATPQFETLSAGCPVLHFVHWCTHLLGLYD
jgi:hypothetical protein